MLSLKAALDAHAASTDRAFGEDRSQTVGASDIGQCLRKTWFAKFEGHEAADRDADYLDRWGAKKRGSIYEDHWWVPALRQAYGARLAMAGDQQRTLFLDYLSATPDGLVTDLPADALSHLGVPDIESDCVAVECKTIDPRVKLDGPKPEHRFQVIVQLGLIRERTNHKPLWGVVCYTDTSFWDDVFEYPVRFDQDTFEVAKQRAFAIMTARRAFDLKPEGKIAGGRECDYCAWKGACSGIQAAAVEALSDVGEVPDEQATGLAERARLARAMKNEGERVIAQAKDLEQDIKTELASLGVRKVRHGDVSVSWSSVKGRPSTDWKGLREAAEEAGVDTSRFTTAGDPTDRLTITVKEKA